MGPRVPPVGEERLTACVHCGLCLNACPTYLELGTEMDSPRGRIYLIGGLQDGTLPLTADVVRHLDLCLGCRACETACPSGVRYGSILEDARVLVETRFRRPFWDRWRRRLAVSSFSRPSYLRLLLSLFPLRLLRALGLWGVVERAVPAARLLPAVSPARRLSAVHAARGAERARVGLLLGCVNRELFGAVNEATIRVLNRNGVAVVLPPEQVCCGALHLHGGDRRGAIALARRNLAAFTADLDAVIVTSAGCGATMKEYGELFGTEVDAKTAAAFATRVRDVNEFLADLPIRSPTRRMSRRVVVHDACHLLHGQGIGGAPRALLRQIQGIELVELAESDLCCGSAGSYNLTEPQMAARLGERKLDNVIRSGASCVAVANPGCALQIQSGLRARGLAVEVLHPVELLDEAYDDTAEALG